VILEHQPVVIHPAHGGTRIRELPAKAGEYQIMHNNGVECAVVSNRLAVASQPQQEGDGTVLAASDCLFPAQPMVGGHQDGGIFPGARFLHGATQLTQSSVRERKVVEVPIALNAGRCPKSAPPVG